MKTRSKIYETSGPTNETDRQNDARKRALNRTEISSSETHITPLVCSHKVIAGVN